MSSGSRDMSHDVETDFVPVTAQSTLSAAARRMRTHRKRRRLGLRCVTVQLRATEVSELTRRGLLKEEERDDYRAVRNAVHHHLDLTLSKRS
jgi:hypothetical protein